MGDGRAERLLVALVALTSVLVVGLAVGGALVWREYERLRSTVELAAGAGSSARELAVEVSRRQQLISQDLAAVVKDAGRQIHEFEGRAQQLRGQGGGPVSSASRAIELTQLMADELLMQLKLMTTLDAALEKAARPVSAERELLQSSGDGGERPTRPRQGRPGQPAR